MLYVVKYSGPFGFIKPWTAVRDGETYSQQFLTPSIVEGIEKRLFPECLETVGVIQMIVRHRLNYRGLTVQQERTWSKGGVNISASKTSSGLVNYKVDNLGILKRGILLYPNLHLAFTSESAARRAFSQQICLCRNEDILTPEEFITVSEEGFDEIEGFELHFTDSERGFKVGRNRFAESAEMFGELRIYGSNPMREQ